jgi:lipopolysaccharide heptosyltransferase II
MKTSKRKKILISRLDRIGDVVLSTPAITALKEAYPRSFLAVMVRPYARDIINGNPFVDEVIIYDKDDSHKGFISTFKFAMNLRKKKFGLYLNLHPTNRSNILGFLAGIPERVGYDRKMGFLLSKRIPHDKQLGEKHEMEYTLDVLRAIGIEPKDKRPVMPIDKNKTESVRLLLKEHGVAEGKKIVVVHPGASCPSKRWPAKRFAALCDRLIGELNVQIIIIAGPDEVELGNGLKEMIKQEAVNLSGATSVADLACLFKLSDLFISNDSGPVHISTAVGTPVISIFGRNERGLGPNRWGPLGRDDVILQKDVGCRECFAHDCPHNFKCLLALSVDEVFDTARKALNRGKNKE